MVVDSEGDVPAPGAPICGTADPLGVLPRVHPQSVETSPVKDFLYAGNSPRAVVEASHRERKSDAGSISSRLSDSVDSDVAYEYLFLSVPKISQFQIPVGMPPQHVNQYGMHEWIPGTRDVLSAFSCTAKASVAKIIATLQSWNLELENLEYTSDATLEFINRHTDLRGRYAFRTVSVLATVQLSILSRAVEIPFDQRLKNRERFNVFPPCIIVIQFYKDTPAATIIYKCLNLANLIHDSRAFEGPIRKSFRKTLKFEYEINKVANRARINKIVDSIPSDTTVVYVDPKTRSSRHSGQPT